MKLLKIVFVAVISIYLWPTNAEAQDKKKIKKDAKNIEFYRSVMDVDDKNFDVVVAPEAWKEESYVLLAVNTYINVGSKNDKLRGINRKRVLIQDQNAVEFFTEFYFQDSETILINITKKSGEEVEVDMKDVVKVSTTVPSIYRSRFQSSQSYKLAIPNLEIGDIVDFTTIYSQSFGNRVSYVDALSDERPILYQNITIDIHKKWDVYRNTFNTKDQFKFFRGKGHAYDGKPDDDMDRYSLSTSNLAAKKENIFENAYDVEPFVKFQGISPAEAFFNYKNERFKENLDVEEILKSVVRKSHFESEFYSAICSKILSNVKANISKKDATNVKADACYYFLREFMNKGYYTHNAIQSVKSEGSTYESIYGHYTSMDEMVFVTLFSYLLRKMDIDAQTVAILPNKWGNYAKAVTINELYFGMYLPNEKLFYWSPNKNSISSDLPFDLMSGGNGISIQSKNKDLDKAPTTKIVIKPVDAKHNFEKNVASVTFNTSDYITTINKELTATGYHKSGYRNFIEEFGDNMYHDFLSMYADDDVSDDLKKFEEQVKKDKKGIYNDFTEKSDKNMSEAFKSWVETKDTKTELLTFETISNGRTFKNPALVVEASYTSDAYLKKLGPNLIFDLGKVIGGQIFVEEKYKNNRLHDILLGAPRQYEYVTEVSIPDGYYIENLDVLNKNISNEYCSFSIISSIEANKLKIRSIKSYDKSFAPKTAWDDIVKVLDEAYKFSQEKIIFKKK